MPRRLCAVLVVLVTVVSASSGVLACGDKFLRVGRSPRFRGYSSVHPSSILIYAPRWTRHGISDFEQILKRGGHKPLTVTTESAMSQAFAAGKYDVVITSYPDTVAVKKQIELLPSGPRLLPLLYKGSKSEAAEASAAYPCLLRPEKMTPFQALEEIDRLLDLRMKDSSPAGATR
jgi:hypothetical protein